MSFSAIEPEGFYIEGLQSLSLSTPLVDYYEEDSVRFCINWGGMLEPVELPSDTTLLEVSSSIDSAAEAQFHHKFFIYKGHLLHPGMTLTEVGMKDGGVLHLVLNDDPFRGRPIYIRSKGDSDGDEKIRMILCGAEFYIEDLKEELSFLPGERCPEEIRLVFAGRELQNHHTLREYNIQKPSVLHALDLSETGRHLSRFVQSFTPQRDQMDVKVGDKLVVCFEAPEQSENHFWGQMLGGPDVQAITDADFEVFACNGNNREELRGRVFVDLRQFTVTWTPLRNFPRGSRILVTLNKGKNGAEFGNLRHSRARENIHGVLSWDFFTEGYEPLRISAIYPRPHSRVACGTCVIAISFNFPLSPSCSAKNWVTVRGHELEDPEYDSKTNTLIYNFKEKPLPSEICRVRLHAELVYGAHNQTLFPRQQDGLLKTSVFRWKFYTCEVSIYEEFNAMSSGLSDLIRAWREKQIRKEMERERARNLQAVEGSKVENESFHLFRPDAAERMDSRPREQNNNDGLGWLNPGNFLGNEIQQFGGMLNWCCTCLTLITEGIGRNWLRTG
mmetsp:Transcript_14392/g.49154  ORF Transcript_14392/g.49154 Transcript_14392/m.49154 type:complete len:558 (-) Transcript_14392:294-1967(-)